MLNKLLDLTDDQRQTLTTWSMMGGTMALTLSVAILVWIQRVSWPIEYAPVLIDGFFHIIFGLLALMGIQIIAQAVIAIGGRLKGSFGGASFEAEAENVVIKSTPE